MTEITDTACRKILQDAAYLQEELNALKKVIQVIPYADRPIGQESVMDMIARIGYAQSVCFFPAILLVLQPGNEKSSIETDYRSTFQPADEEDDLSVNRIIDQITEERKTMVSLLQNASYSVFYEMIPHKDLEHLRLYNLMQEMVWYERSQLRQIAERVLSIDMEQRNGHYNH